MTVGHTTWSQIKRKKGADGIGRPVDLDISGSITFQLNTSNKVKNVGGLVDPGFRYRIQAAVTFIGFADATGVMTTAVRVAVDHARDRIWTLNSVEVWHLVTGTLGWTADDYQDRIGDLMCAATLRPELRQRELDR